MDDRKPGRRWMPLVLGLSLALNLAVVAAVAGAAWRHRGGEGDSARMARGGMIYTQALPRERSRAMWRDLRATGRDARRSGEATGEMLEALRAEPFDPSAVVRVLEAQRDASLRRQDLATRAWLAQIEDMDRAERNAYADRLQELQQARAARQRERDKAPSD